MAVFDYKEECIRLCKELIDATAKSIEGRMEAWDLIDRMLSYVKEQASFSNPYWAKTQSLLAEIEDKRTPHG